MSANPAAARSAAALRPYLPADLPALAAIFEAAIAGLTGEDYSEAQQAAWIAALDDAEAFAARLKDALTLVATVDGAPAGFASLAGPDRIDLLYVHPDHSRAGVATLLVDALEKLAAARGARALTVESSDTARPLFEKRGYEPRHRQTVELNGEWFGNTLMRKSLA